MTSVPGEWMQFPSIPIGINFMNLFFQDEILKFFFSFCGQFLKSFDHINIDQRVNLLIIEVRRVTSLQVIRIKGQYIRGAGMRFVLN
jgi:hypothetical protein